MTENPRELEVEESRRRDSLESKGHCYGCFWLGPWKTIILLFILVDILTSIYMQKGRGGGGRTDLIIISWLDFQVEHWMKCG